MLRVFILFIAIVAGGLAAWLALSARSGNASTTVVTAAPQAPMAEVLVASADLNQGQPLSDTNIRWQPWPKDAITPGLISRSTRPDAIATFKGSVVRSHFITGEPIREEKLARGSGLLASMLPAGKRAVAIRVSAESTAGGFILPNDRVDVIQTVARQGPQTQSDNVSNTILSNIRVLAVDQKADEGKGQSVVIGKTATLELSSAQAELIAASQASGILSLALRSVADGDEPVVNRQSSSSVRILRAGKTELVQVQ
jgi:pilus assembly protein CpaB